MRRKLMTSSAIANLMLVAGAAVAADPVSVNGGTAHFGGELVNTACIISTQSSDQVVTLDQYCTAGFTAVGDTAAQIPFLIVLNGCDPKVAATAAVAFSGQSDITNNDLLTVTSVDNDTTASGVGIEILDNTSTALRSDGATFSTAQALVEGTNTLRFPVRYKATAANATPGQVNADTAFIMKYE